MVEIPLNKKIILFDGVCNLCESSVQFIIKHDKKDVFRFVSLQSNLGQQILEHLGIESSSIDSIVLYEPGIAYYYKAEAALLIAKELKGWYFILSYFLIFGKSLNFIYDYIAKNRYKWFGKKESCMIPTEALKAKFL